MEDSEASSVRQLGNGLVQECHGLLSEIEQFERFLKERGRENVVELKPFQNAVRSELRSLENLTQAEPTERSLHTLRSSNLPFCTAVWNTAKSTYGLTAFTKRFYWGTPPTRDSKRATTNPKRRCALVDIVAQDGLQWIKVSTVTENRLLFDLAKEGWEGASSDDERDGVAVGQDHDLEEDHRIEVIRQADDLRKASLAHKVRYKHPSVFLILPKISPNPPSEIASIISSLRSTGATVRLGSGSPSTDLSSIFPNLLPDQLCDLTATINIDCTILLALVSDLSHSSTNPEPWFHKAITRQIEREEKEHLLLESLWPAMIGRKLVCTEEAAQRMKEIVGCIGTVSERQRTNLILSSTSLSPEYIHTEFAKLSTYAIPPDWNIPIEVVEAHVEMQDLPPVAEKVKMKLTKINQSVFLYGWARGWCTLSSNRTVAKLIEEIVNGADATGPAIWLCSTARSLVGKEKGRR
ncbi:MAG: hypothetical protein LQ342_008232 [Letrouitia transgressa]|nr:MAG: hypothetical protein LQ342_008232 [Letrouitia transgressa]